MPKKALSRVFLDKENHVNCPKCKERVSAVPGKFECPECGADMICEEIDSHL